MLYICEIHYLSLDWHEWFSKNERFTAAGSLGRENLMFALPIMHDGHDQKHNYENFTSSFGRVGKRKCTKKRAARAARFFSLRSTNQIIDLCHCRCFRHFLNSLIANGVRER